ncbi:MAG: ABC transporter substrate-binding protein [Dehalococcoidia bacterium]|nr:ABC transporter substrate-binding protein [Dehalococcoidia bacterium]
METILAYPEGEPLVPGGPAFYPHKLIAENEGVKLLYEYHQTKLPLWKKAQYGGESVTNSFTGWNPAYTLEYLHLQSLNRPSFAGMLLLFDMGRCSMVGRDSDYSVCNGEYAHNQSIAIVPSVFQTWELPDPLTYVFHIRKGVLWPAIAPMTRTDREVTSDDIVWFLGVQKSEGILKDNFQLVQNIEAVDRYTVKLTMSAPHFEFLRHMANSSMGLFPKECYDEKGCLGGKLLSPAPFLVKDNETEVLGKVVLVRNPEFFLKGLPYIDRWVGIAIPEPAAQKAAFTTNKVDEFFVFQPSEVAGYQRASPGVQVHAQAVLGGTTVLRPQLKGPLADVRVRRAMTLAMDLPSVWQGAYENFAYFPNLVSRDFFGADWYYTLDQAGQYYQLDVARAKQLMAEAGYANGFKTDIILPSFFSSGGPYDAMVVLQANWKKNLGIDVKINIADYVAWATQLYDHSWNGLYHQYGWNISYWAEGETALSHFTKGQALNFQEVDDPWVTELYPQVRSEMDPAKRAAMLWEFEKHELENIYLIRIAPPTSLQLMQPWTLNGAAHQVAWWCCFNGPSWLTMLDLSKVPNR